MTDYGITAVSAYVPRLRLRRAAIASAHQWANPNLAAQAKGEKAFCGSDEDAVTLAVAAGNSCLKALDQQPQNLAFASTSMPFLDRQHSTLIGEALGLPDHIRTLDTSSSQRAATSALIQQLELGQHQASAAMLIAAENRATQAGSMAEMQYGDAATAIASGSNPIAKYLGSASVSVDFIDHYRTNESEFDYSYEERWIRDEGYNSILPQVTQTALSNCALDAENLSHLILPLANSRTAASIAKLCGLENAKLMDNLAANIGLCGCAHPLLMLSECLKQCKPGETVLLIGFGQGADALLFEVTEKILDWHNATSSISKGHAIDAYTRFLSHKNQLSMDWGMRGERDNRTAMSVYFRKRKAINAFVGGQCRDCNTIQFPFAKICVNPDCGALDSMDDYSLRNESGKVKSFTEDWLAHSTNPPLKYGNVQFDNGANVMMEFCDLEVGELAVGQRVQPAFRIKDVDQLRGMKRYFWKAVPMDSAS